MRLMVSTYTDKIDFDRLEKEGLSAIDKDARYWRENDAKFRAVNQKVASYEEFRDIVLASHLKPLGKAEKLDFAMGQRKSTCWNAMANKTVIDVHGNEVIISSGFEMPTSSAEFCKYWRHIDSESERLNFLLCFEPNAIGELFKTEIPAGVLVDIINVLNFSMISSKADSSALQAMNILQQLSQSSRFSLNLMFLAEKEKHEVKGLFDMISQCLCGSDEQLMLALKDLKARYSVQ